MADITRIAYESIGTFSTEEPSVDISRCLRTPEAEGANPSFEISEVERAGKYLAFDAEGNVEFKTPEAAAVKEGTGLQEVAETEIVKIEDEESTSGAAGEQMIALDVQELPNQALVGTVLSAPLSIQLKNGEIFAKGSRIYQAGETVHFQAGEIYTGSFWKAVKSFFVRVAGFVWHELGGKELVKDIVIEKIDQIGKGGKKTFAVSSLYGGEAGDLDNYIEAPQTTSILVYDADASTPQTKLQNYLVVAGGLSGTTPEDLEPNTKLELFKLADADGNLSKVGSTVELSKYGFSIANAMLDDNGNSVCYFVGGKTAPESTTQSISFISFVGDTISTLTETAVELPNFVHTRSAIVKVGTVKYLCVVGNVSDLDSRLIVFPISADGSISNATKIEINYPTETGIYNFIKALRTTAGIEVLAIGKTNEKASFIEAVKLEDNAGTIEATLIDKEPLRSKKALTEVKTIQASDCTYICAVAGLDGDYSGDGSIANSEIDIIKVDGAGSLNFEGLHNLDTPVIDPAVATCYDTEEDKIKVVILGGYNDTEQRGTNTGVIVEIDPVATETALNIQPGDGIRITNDNDAIQLSVETIDNLESNSVVKPLSAKQGQVLNQKILNSFFINDFSSTKTYSDKIGDIVSVSFDKESYSYNENTFRLSYDMFVVSKQGAFGKLKCTNNIFRQDTSFTFEPIIKTGLFDGDVVKVLDLENAKHIFTANNYYYPLVNLYVLNPNITKEEMDLLKVDLGFVANSACTANTLGNTFTVAVGKHNAKYYFSYKSSLGAISIPQMQSETKEWVGVIEVKSGTEGVAKFIAGTNDGTFASFELSINMETFDPILSNYKALHYVGTQPTGICSDTFKFKGDTEKYALFATNYGISVLNSSLAIQTVLKKHADMHKIKSLHLRPLTLQYSSVNIGFYEALYVICDSASGLSIWRLDASEIQRKIVNPSDNTPLNWTIEEISTTEIQAYEPYMNFIAKEAGQFLKKDKFLSTKRLYNQSGYAETSATFFEMFSAGFKTYYTREQSGDPSSVFKIVMNEDGDEYTREKIAQADTGYTVMKFALLGADSLVIFSYNLNFVTGKFEFFQHYVPNIATHNPADLVPATLITDIDAPTYIVKATPNYIFVDNEYFYMSTPGDSSNPPVYTRESYPASLLGKNIVGATNDGTILTQDGLIYHAPRGNTGTAVNLNTVFNDFGSLLGDFSAIVSDGTKFYCLKGSVCLVFEMDISGFTPVVNLASRQVFDYFQDDILIPYFSALRMWYQSSIDAVLIAFNAENRTETVALKKIAGRVQLLKDPSDLEGMGVTTNNFMYEGVDDLIGGREVNTLTYWQPSISSAVIESETGFLENINDLYAYNLPESTHNYLMAASDNGTISIASVERELDQTGKPVEIKNYLRKQDPIAGSFSRVFALENSDQSHIGLNRIVFLGENGRIAIEEEGGSGGEAVQFLSLDVTRQLTGICGDSAEIYIPDGEDFKVFSVYHATTFDGYVLKIEMLRDSTYGTAPTFTTTENFVPYNGVVLNGGIAYCKKTDVFVAVGESGIYAYKKGIAGEWVINRTLEVSTNKFNFKDIKFIKELNKFYAVGTDGLIVSISADGKEITNLSDETVNFDFFRVNYFIKTIVLASESGKIALSVDGTNFVIEQTDLSGNITGLGYLHNKLFLTSDDKLNGAAYFDAKGVIKNLVESTI